jgi:SAM-dependent methyltransferase
MPEDDLPQTALYFGRGYYHLYRNYLLPEEQTRAEAAFIVRTLRPRSGARWLDLPCGYGRHLVELKALRPDLRLAGGDLSRDYLREPGLRQAAAPFACDMRRLPLASASFDAVLNLLNSFGYYPPPRGRAGRHRELDDRDMLAECARVLRPGGRLLLDLANRRALVRLIERQPLIRYAGGEWEVVEHFAWDPALEEIRNETVWRWPNGEELARYRLRLYTPGQIRTLLERNGLELVKLFGGFDGSPLDPFTSDRMLVIARKKR